MVISGGLVKSSTIQRKAYISGNIIFSKKVEFVAVFSYHKIRLFKDWEKDQWAGIDHKKVFGNVPLRIYVKLVILPWSSAFNTVHLLVCIPFSRCLLDSFQKTLSCFIYVLGYTALERLHGWIHTPAYLTAPKNNHSFYQESNTFT